MKLHQMLDYFGPQIDCRVKCRYLGENNHVFETDGFIYPSEDEPFYNAYVVIIGIQKDGDGPYIEPTLEG